jgi:hypothetical protein
MAEYKAPRSREAIKNMARKVLVQWIDETLDDSGDTSTIWDDADDWAARTYEYETEDGLAHAAAMRAAKERFWEELRMGLESQICGVFERLGK